MRNNTMWTGVRDAFSVERGTGRFNGRRLKTLDGFLVRCSALHRAQRRVPSGRASGRACSQEVETDTSRQEDLFTGICLYLYSVDRNGLDVPGNCPVMEHSDDLGHCGVLIMACKNLACLGTNNCAGTFPNAADNWVLAQDGPALTD